MYHEFNITLVDRKASELTDKEVHAGDVKCLVNLSRIEFLRPPTEEDKEETMLHFFSGDSLVVNTKYEKVVEIMKEHKILF